MGKTLPSRSTALLLARLLLVASLLTVPAPAAGDHAIACPDEAEPVALEPVTTGQLDPGQADWYAQNSTGAASVVYTLTATNGSASLHLYEPGDCSPPITCEPGNDARFEEAGEMTCIVPAGDHRVRVTPYLFAGDGPVDYTLATVVMGDEVETPSPNVEVEVTVEVTVGL